MQLACASCGAANRLPDGRDPLAAKCGRCGHRLFDGQPSEVSAAGLRKLRNASRGVALLVDVWAPWCGPCRAMAPQFAAAASQLEPQARLLKLNSEAEPQAAAELGIHGIPALILIRDGTEIARTTGAMGADQIVAWTRQALARADARVHSGA
ncbi:MAG: thiol reductase thioredoxin [Proteobacteria bacterium]|nr:thiol reductase thioredoxin [Pseudomonadota bacterium]